MTSLLLNPAAGALAGALADLEEKAPAPEDVKAGWGAFWIFVALAVAVALLGWSLVRQLRKTDANAEAGVFGPEDVPQPAEPENGEPEADGEPADSGQ